MANPHAAINGEPVIPPLTMQQFIELGKLPDFLRDLQPFDGRPTELINWLADVQGVIDMYREHGATDAQLELIGRSVRRKIKGEAADILNANNIMHNWNNIKSTLLLYYKDKRDLKTLDFELTSIKKAPNESLGSYYSRVNELLSSIIAQIQTEPKFFLHANSHIDYFREKAIDSFIRGLEKPLCQLLKTYNPKTLNHAYQFCLEYFNMDTRSAPYRNEHTSNIPRPRDLEPPRLPPRRQPLHPTIPPRNHQPVFHQARPMFNHPFPQPKFQNNPFHQPHAFQQPRFQNNPFPQTNRPLPNPEPMDVDPSIRSRNINYSNRPQMGIKRPHQSFNQPQHFKRMAHPLQYDYSYDPYYFYPDYIPEYDDMDYQYDPQEEQPQPEFLQNDTPTSEASLINQEEDPQPSTSSQTNFLEWKPSW